MMLEFRTPNFKGFSAKYSPFFDSKIAVAAGQNFGLVGNGRLFVLGLTPNGIVAERWFETQDSLYDITWSEINENQLLAGSGDGSLRLYDVQVPEFPIQTWQEHSREVFSTHWNLLSKTTFLSSSWDGCIKVYNPLRDESIVTLQTHSCTYSAQFSPHGDSIVSGVTSDSRLLIYDLRTPASARNHLMLESPIHVSPKSRPGMAPSKGLPPAEALTHSWNFYRDSIVATGGVDRLIRTFDIRNIANGPIALLPGHEYAVRKVSWSPHLSDVLLSASYDMTCRIWSDGSSMGVDPTSIADPMAFGGGKELGCMNRHTEFVTGVDWCLFGAEGWCASVGWDERVIVWDTRDVMGRMRT